MTRPFNPYGSYRRTEPDMRQELINTLDGTFPETAKKQKFVVRKMRLSDGILQACPCIDSTTGEPDKDTFCPICFGEGYLWDESLVDGYKVVLGSSVGGAGKETLISPGNINLQYATFYLRYDFSFNVPPVSAYGRRSTRKMITPDKLIELVTDSAGSPVRPYQRQRIFRIGTMIDFRADNGKLEYWKLDCYEEQVKFLNGSTG